MEQEVNNFVRDARRLGVAKSDIAILKYSAIGDEEAYSEIERIENILANARDNLVGILNSEMNQLPRGNFSVVVISENISKAVLLIGLLKEDFAPIKADLLEMLEGCLTSLSEKNFTNVLTALKQDQEKFYKHKISLQDICSEDLLGN